MALGLALDMKSVCHSGSTSLLCPQEPWGMNQPCLPSLVRGVSLRPSLPALWA